MKPLILFYLILLFTQSSTVAQTYSYVPLPQKNVRWEYAHTLTARYYYQWMLDGSDTVFDGIAYKKIMVRFEDKSNKGPLPWPRKSTISPYPDEFVGAMREQDKIVYMRRFDTYGWKGEKVMFDFNAKEGEFIRPHFIVEDIDTVTVAGTIRKIFHVSSTLIYNKFSVVEGSYDLNTVVYVNVGDNERFVCSSIDDEHLFDSRECSYIWPNGTPQSVGNFEQQKQIKIYPTSFDNVINIQAPVKGYGELYNTAGIRISRVSLTGNTEKIITSEICNGLYIIILFDAEGQVILRQKMVKQ